MQVYTGGMAPTSIQNWKKSSCLAIFLAGCDFNCPYCSTPELLKFKEEYILDILEVKRQINSFSNSVETVLFTGGEPCLQRQALLNLARHCKQIGLNVGLETNGARPSTIVSLLREGILDFIEIDLKSPPDEDSFEKATKSKTFFKPTSEIIKEVKETIGILKKNEDKVQVTFKTTIVPGMLSFDDMCRIGEMIKYIRCVWVLQPFSPEVTHDKTMMAMQETKPEELIVLKERLNNKFPMMHIEI